MKKSMMKRSMQAVLLAGILLIAFTFVLQGQDAAAVADEAVEAQAASTDSLALVLAFIGFGLMIGLSGTGSAIGTCIGARATVGALKKREEAFGSYLVLAAFPGTQGLYGFGCYFILSGIISAQPGGWEALTILQGSVILGAGIFSGIIFLLSAVKEGQVGADSIAAIASGHDVFGKSMILVVVPELYAIIAFASVFLVSAYL
jgi:V/A-type H+-transporting ATPase subunit K